MENSHFNSIILYLLKSFVSNPLIVYLSAVWSMDYKRVSAAFL